MDVACGVVGARKRSGEITSGDFAALETDAVGFSDGCPGDTFVAEFACKTHVFDLHEAVRDGNRQRAFGGKIAGNGRRIKGFECCGGFRQRILRKSFFNEADAPGAGTVLVRRFG